MGAASGRLARVAYIRSKIEAVRRYLVTRGVPVPAGGIIYPAMSHLISKFRTSSAYRALHPQGKEVLPPGPASVGDPLSKADRETVNAYLDYKRSHPEPKLRTNLQKRMQTGGT